MPTSIIAEWTELLEKAEGGDRHAGSVREYSKTWRLRLTTPFAEARQVLTDPDLPDVIPGIGDFYQAFDDNEVVVDEDAGAFCVSRDVRKIGEEEAFCDLTAKWTTDYDENAGNPLTAREVPEWGGKFVEVVLQTDLNGIGINNDAGDPITGARGERYITTLTVTKNVEGALLNQFDFQRWANRTNETTWHGYDPGKVLHKIHTAQPAFANGIRYWVYKHNFEIKDDGRALPWRLRLLNAGFRYRPIAGADPVLATTGGVPANQQVLLKPDGTRFTNAEMSNPAFTPIYKELDIVGTLDFSVFGISNIELP
jgi:hypothetical protein